MRQPCTNTLLHILYKQSATKQWPFYTWWVYVYFLPFLHLKLGINFASNILFCIGYVCMCEYASKRCLYVPVEFPVNCFHNNMNVYVCILTKTRHTFVECFGLHEKGGLGKQLAADSRSQWPVKISESSPCHMRPPYVCSQTNKWFKTHGKEYKLFNLKVFWTER